MVRKLDPELGGLADDLVADLLNQAVALVLLYHTRSTSGYSWPGLTGKRKGDAQIASYSPSDSSSISMQSGFGHSQTKLGRQASPGASADDQVPVTGLRDQEKHGRVDGLCKRP